MNDIILKYLEPIYEYLRTQEKLSHIGAFKIGSQSERFADNSRFDTARLNLQELVDIYRKES